MFNSEQEMSITFEKYLKKTFGNSFVKEQQGLFGIPDFVLYEKKKNNMAVISFELKLKNWKKAAQQAFRYRSFSNIVYVVIESQGVKAAMKNIDMFIKYNIGLASFEKDNGFTFVFKPKVSEPYSDTLRNKFINEIPTKKNKTKNFEMLAA